MQECTIEDADGHTREVFIWMFRNFQQSNRPKRKLQGEPYKGLLQCLVYQPVEEGGIKKERKVERLKG
jgi:hypothetical protein